MEPRSITIKNAEEIHNIFRVYRCHYPVGWWFRGQADSNWELIPKAGRNEFKLPNNRFLGRFKEWTRKAIAYDNNLPKNDWELLAVAQHYGLATCLLDWSENPLVAVYFACCNLPNKEATVYCFDPEIFVDENKFDLWSVSCNGAGFMPRAILPRILNQCAVFTVHIPTNQSMEIKEHPVLKGVPNLTKILIPGNIKYDMLLLLNDYGVNHATLFPDLGGLSEFINWKTHNMVK